MIRWMCGYTIVDKIRNEVIRDIVKVAPIKDKMRDTGLRWLLMRRGRVWMPLRGDARRLTSLKVKEEANAQRRA